MSQINTFIFDIDGTLIDTFDMYMPAMVTVLRKHGYKIAPEDEVPTMQRLFGITGVDALKIFGVRPAEIPEIQAEWTELTHQRQNYVTVLDQIPEALAKLAAVDGNQLGVATSKMKKEYDRFTKQYDFANYFTTAITSADTTKHKPDPEPILAAVEKMGAKPEQSVYVGDTINDLKAAKAAGVKFAGALYGSANPDAIKDADYPLVTPMDLLKI